jgi:hypothetical protein
MQQILPCYVVRNAEDWISKLSNTIVHIRLSVRFIDYRIKGAMPELYIFPRKKKVNVFLKEAFDMPHGKV